MPTAEEFRQRLYQMFQAATQQGQVSLDVEAGKLHRLVGGYPSQGDHKMPVCCHVMRSEMKSGDSILRAPPKGNGASLAIRYTLPRR